jgi:tetratricopeptide (TPR) repeat protein
MPNTFEIIGAVLARKLPSLKNPLQLAGLVILIIAALIHQLSARPSVTVVLSAGAVGVCLIVFAQLFPALNNFSEHHRPAVFLVSFAIFCTFIVVLMVISIFPIKRSGADTACLDALRAADSIHNAGHHQGAVNAFEAAKRLCPSTDFRPLSGVAAARYMLGNYSDSAKAFQEAFDTAKQAGEPRAFLGRLLVGKAYALEGMKLYDEARKAHSVAEKQFEPTDYDFLDAQFSQGRTELILWIDDHFRKNSERWSKAVAIFDKLVVADNFPKAWAHYNLACLRTIEDSHTKSLTHLMGAIKALLEDKTVNVRVQREMLKRLLADPNYQERKPTEPTPCPPLARVLQENKEQVRVELERL